MTSIGSYAAKTHLPQLLERVARGERIIITKRGMPVALLTQPPRTIGQDIRNVIAQMKALRRDNRLGRGVSVRDLIEEGRRF